MDGVMLSDTVSERIKHWVTWRVVAELMRRHKASRDLRVYELHPAGGMGDTLAIREDGGGSSAMRDNDFRGWRRLGESPQEPFGSLESQGGYVWPWLRADDPRQVVDDVERLLGLPTLPGRLPASSPTVKTFGLMADILGLGCQRRAPLQWRAAFYDTSDGGGCELRKSFQAFPHLVKRLPPGELYLSGQQFWMLLQTAGHFCDELAVPLMVVDLRGTAWIGPSMDVEVDIVECVRKQGSSLSAAAWAWREAGLS
jgi:hypothetical protein